MNNQKKGLKTSVPLLAVAEQAEGQQLGLLPVGGGHVVFAVALLEGLADPDPAQLADQGVLAGQPALVVLHDDADDLAAVDKGVGRFRKRLVLFIKKKRHCSGRDKEFE